MDAPVTFNHQLRGYSDTMGNALRADETLAVETELLLRLAKRQLDAEDIGECQLLLSSNHDKVNWGAFIELACRHRVMPLVGRNITELGLHRRNKTVPGIPHGWLYTAAYESNKRRNRILFAEFARIFVALNETGLKYAVRKGPLLCELLYGDVGARRIGDLDLLVRQSDTTHVAEVLDDLGYLQGRFDNETKNIEPHDRRTKLFWKMQVDNLLPFIKVVDDAEVEGFKVDVCTNIFEKESRSEWEVDALLSRAETVSCCGESVKALDAIDGFIDLCLHLHKEADARYYIEAGRDLALLKFLDVAEAFRQLTLTQDAKLIADRVSTFNAQRGVYFALHHAATMFPWLEVKLILERLDIDDLAFLEGYGYREGKPIQWERPLIKRMFDDSDREQIVGSSTVPRGD